jgi:nitroreductase
MEMYDAISYRKSTRKYSTEALSAEQLQAVKAIIDSAERLYNNIDMKINLVVDGHEFFKLLPGIIGGYGKIKAPHYLVVTSEEKEGSLQNIGCTLQGVVLRLTAMNIATCWIGGNIKDGLSFSSPDIPEEHKPQVVIALGNPQNGISPFRQNSEKAKRKDISEITSGSMDITWSKIMSAVRLAPSAANTQPWRFVFKDGKVNVYSAKTAGFVTKHFLGSLNHIDIGIALCHVMVASRHFSRNIRFTIGTYDKIKDWDYVTTIIEV